MKQLTTLVLLLFTLVAFSQRKFEGKATYKVMFVLFSYIRSNKTRLQNYTN